MNFFSTLIALFRNQKFLHIFYQIVTISVVVLLIYNLLGNMFDNLEQRGINTGFDFLNHSSGFYVLQTLIDYTSQDSHLKVFYVGILNTLLVSAISIVLATFIGLIIALGRLSSNWLISKLCLIYIEFFRNIPILLQIIFWYNIVLAALPSPRASYSLFESFFLNNRSLYLPKPIVEDGLWWILGGTFLLIALIIYAHRYAVKKQDETGEYKTLFSVYMITPIVFIIWFLIVVYSSVTFEYPVLIGFNFKGGISIIPELMALSFALSIYTATYIAESIRAGIESVSKGQSEASNALGLPKSIILYKIILPQALRVSIPPIVNFYANIVKNSSLATAVGYPELVTIFAGTSLNIVGQAIEIILMTMAVYLTINISISLTMNYFNAKVKLKER